MAIQNIDDVISTNEDQAGALRSKIWRLKGIEAARLRKLGVSDREINFSESVVAEIAAVQLELDCIKSILVGQRAYRKFPPISSGTLVNA